MITLHLRPDGNDETGDGTASAPVATLARAIALARGRGGRRRILAAGGCYPDTEAVLETRDSGLVIAAAPGTRPLFLGGRRLFGWRPEGEGSPFWLADAPGTRDGAWDFRALMIGDRLAPRARYPEVGTIPHESRFEVRWMSSTKGGWERKPTEEELTTLRLAPDSLPPGFSIANAELTLYHSWDESLVGVREWDRENRLIRFSTPAGHPPGAFGNWKEQARTFVAWNIREGMTRPGQWYLDRERGAVVYWPLPGETPDRLQAWAPTRTAILRLQGTPEAPVTDIRLKGLAFALTTTPLLAGGFGALKFEGAIEGRCAHRLQLEGVEIYCTGGQGIRVMASDRVRCRNGEIRHAGAGGLVLDGRDGRVEDMLIHHNGRIYPSALALRVSGECWRVSHNTLHHTPYSAINAGGRRLVFESNRFHHVMEELVDGAAIYVFAGKHCRLRGNYTSDVRDEQVHAYYLDEQSEHCTVDGNLAVDVPWPLHMHMASCCIIRNNIAMNRGPLTVSLANCHGFVLEGNVLSAGGKLSIQGSYTGLAALKRNLFWSGTGGIQWDLHDRLPSLERNPGPVPLLPQHAHTLIADPQASCPDAGRVAFADGSPAAALRIRPLDVRGAGCRRPLREP